MSRRKNLNPVLLRGGPKRPPRFFMPLKRPKLKKHIGPENIKKLHGVSCLLNNKTCTIVTDAHYVKTRGAGGGDEPENLMPLCRVHLSEIHMTGHTYKEENI